VSDLSADERSWVERVGPVVVGHTRAQAAWRTAVAGGRVDDRPERLLFVSGAPVPWMNGVVAARLPPGEHDRWIDEASAALRAAGVSGLWWVDPWTRPANLAERLLTRGFRPEEDLPWLATELQGVDLGERPVDGLAVRRVVDDETQAAWLHAMEHGFGTPGEVLRQLDAVAKREGYGPDASWTRFAGYLGGEPVASSGLLLFEGVAGVYNVTTVPKARRRGIGTAMSLTAMREGRARGADLAILGATELGRGVYEGLGFRDVCSIRTFRWEPGPEPA
jgi:ribosomal protein S18 acetylase RimI-like enzyme